MINRLLVGLAVMIAAALVLALVGSLSPRLLTFDAAVAEWFAARRIDWLVSTLRALSWLAKVWLLVPLLLIGGIIVARRTGRIEALWLPATAGAGGFFISVATKFIVFRPRPGPEISLIDALGPSYPSGHMIRATAVYFAIAVLVRRFGAGPVIQALAWIGAFAVVGIAAVTRTYEAAHWLSDMLASGVLGVAWLVILLRATDGGCAGTPSARSRSR